MERAARLISTYCRGDWISSSLFDRGLRYLGTRSFSGHASLLKEVDPTRHGLHKGMSGSSSSIFCVQRNSSLVCTACTAITQGSNRPWSFHSSSQPSTKRWFSRSSTLMKRLAPEEVKKRVEGLTDRFAEARELLGDAVCLSSTSSICLSFFLSSSSIGCSEARARVPREKIQFL